MKRKWVILGLSIASTALKLSTMQSGFHSAFTETVDSIRKVRSNMPRHIQDQVIVTHQM